MKRAVLAALAISGSVVGTVVVGGGVGPAVVVAQSGDTLDDGAGYHVTWHGWSEDGWVHWQNDCYAGGCTGWYVASVGG